ncbi:MAG: hypothetical protein WCO10_01230 [bacterium]
MKKRQSKILNGVVIERDERVVFCHINDFTDEIKDEIRLMLNSIFHGSAEVKENSEIYNYKNTVINFVDRYKNHSEKTKKGMIGELLTHLLIPRCISNFESISIFKNKEEKSIKKGFDIVYFDKNDLWYCEVKSGENKNINSINQCNSNLLNKAKTQANTTTRSTRSTLWDSVLTDIHLTIFNSKKRKKVRELLNNDHPSSSPRNLERNVVLTSVIFNKHEEKICIDKLKKYGEKVEDEKIFTGLLIFSIQKSTYEKIEHFLIEESVK